MTIKPFSYFSFFLCAFILSATLVSVLVLPSFPQIENTNVLGVDSGSWVEYHFDCFGTHSLLEERTSARVEFLDVSGTDLTYRITSTRKNSTGDSSTIITSLEGIISQYRQDFGRLGFAPLVIPVGFDVSDLNMNFANQSLGLGWVFGRSATDFQCTSTTDVRVAGGVNRTCIIMNLKWRQDAWDNELICTVDCSWDRETGILLAEDLAAFGPFVRNSTAEPSEPLFDYESIRISNTNLWAFSYPASDQILKMAAIGAVVGCLGLGANFRRLGNRIRNRRNGENLE